MTIGTLLFSLQGRLPRKPFWLGMLGLIVAESLLLFLLIALVGRGGPAHLVLLAEIPIHLLIFWIAIALTVKRLHDRNRPGWSLLILVPFPPAIFVLLVVAAMRGTVGENRFGPDPLASSTEVVTLLPKSRRARIITIGIVLIVFLLVAFGLATLFINDTEPAVAELKNEIMDVVSKQAVEGILKQGDDPNLYDIDAYKECVGRYVVLKLSFDDIQKFQDESTREAEKEKLFSVTKEGVDSCDLKKKATPASTGQAEPDKANDVAQGPAGPAATLNGPGNVLVELKVSPEKFGQDQSSAAKTPHECIISASVTNKTENHLSAATVMLGGKEAKIGDVAANQTQVFPLFRTDPDHGSCETMAKIVFDTAPEATVTNCAMANLTEGKCQATFAFSGPSETLISGFRDYEKALTSNIKAGSSYVEQNGTRQFGSGGYYVVGYEAMISNAGPEDDINDSAKHTVRVDMADGDVLQVVEVYQDATGLDDWYHVRKIGQASAENSPSNDTWIPAKRFQKLIEQTLLAQQTAEPDVQTGQGGPEAGAPPRFNENSPAPALSSPPTEQDHAVAGVYCGRPVTVQADSSGKGSYKLRDGHYDGTISADVKLGSLDHDIVVHGETLQTERSTANFWSDAFAPSSTCLCVAGSLEEAEDKSFVFRRIDGYAHRDEAACSGIPIDLRH